MRKTEFVNGEFYHIYNRGVEKRDVFLDEQDYFRAIHSLYVFNDRNPHVHLAHQGRKKKIQSKHNIQGSTLDSSSDDLLNNESKRDVLVEIIAFCLMPNHYHLLLRQSQEGGIVKFMQKFGTGYTMYFNERYERSGVLFQGKFKSILVDKEEYFLTLLNYIHLNPVELVEHGWKENGINDLRKALKFLEGYRWSSYLDYIGIQNFPSLIYREPVINYFPDLHGHRDYTIQWLKQDLDSIKDLILE